MAERRVWRVLAAAVALAAVAALYVTRLDVSPVYLTHDEAQFARQAHSLATAGTDLDGHRWPMYFSEPLFPAGREPMSIYLTAALLAIRPLSVITIRFPAALVGVLDVALMFVLARYLFKRTALAAVASMLLALSSGHFIYGRVAMDVVYPLPFAMLWLLGLAVYLDGGPLWALIASACALGAGMYSYLVATILAPAYMTMTEAALLARRRVGAAGAAALAFAILILPLAVWHLLHRERYADLVSYYKLYDGRAFNPLQGVKDILSYFGLGVRVSTYWDCLNPGFLFFSGDSSVMNSTRRVGVFPLPMLIFLPLGIRELIRRRTPLDLILVAGVFLGPIPSIMTAEVATRRIILMLPFAVIVATYGVAYLLTHPRWFARAAAVVLIALVPLQFAGFYRDFMGDYRQRSAFWFGGNIVGALEEVVRLQDDSRPPPYFSRKTTYVDEYWPYTLAVHHREELATRERYVEPTALDATAVPPRTLLLASVAERLETILKTDQWSLIDTIHDPGGAASYVIYERR